MPNDGTPPKYIVLPMLEWEDAMSPLAGRWSDCEAVLFRIQKALERAPWLESLLGPTIPLMQGIRDGMGETLDRAFDYWDSSFWKPLHELGFDDPEPD